MKTVGETLQSVRLKQNLSLEQIAQQTYIKIEFLKAIEAGEFGELPSPVAVQGFISTYAQVLGVEPTIALSLLRRDYKVTKKSVLPKLAQEIKRKSRHRGNRFRFGVLLSTLVVGVTLFYFLWSYTQINKPPKLVVKSPQNGTTVRTTFVVRGFTDSDATLEIDTQPVSLTQDGEFSQEISLSPGEHTVTVVSTNRRKQETINQLFLRVE